MKFHALFFILEKAAKFEIFVCCELWVTLYGLNTFAEVSSWDRGLNFGLSRYLHPILYACSSKGLGESAHVRAWLLANAISTKTIHTHIV